jgi:hypothetical protein
MGPSGYLNVCLEDNESYSEHSYAMSSSTASDSFLDSIISDGIRPIGSPLTNPYSSNSSSIHFPTSFGPRSVGTSDSGVQDTSSPQRDQQNITIRLLDVQRHLEKLSRTFTDGVTTAEDIRDMYRVSETLLGVIGHVEEQLQRRQHLSQPSDFISNGAVVLLLSSCYLNLIQTYQRLVVVLEQELSGNARTPVTTEEGHGQARGNNSSPGSATGSSPQFPSISVGGLRLEMPRKAAAEINLHLVAQTVQNLKASLQRCTRWLSSVRSSPPSSSSSSSPYDINWDQQSDRLEGLNPMKSLIDLALGDLNTREENLLGHLRTVMFSAGARSYYT